MRQNKPTPAIPKQHGRMGKLQFTSSVAVKWSGRGMVSVPALPYRGDWAVTRLNEYSTSVTYIPTGEKCMDVRNLRVGRMVCAVMNALDYQWPKQAHEFRETVWYEWLKAVRQ